MQLTEQRLAAEPCGSARAASDGAVLTLPESVVELRMSVARSRLIKVVGVRADGSAYERQLFVNQHGKLQLL